MKYIKEGTFTAQFASAQTSIFCFGTPALNSASSICLTRKRGKSGSLVCSDRKYLFTFTIRRK